MVYGPLEDHEYDPQDDERGERLLECCGESRPRNMEARIIVVRPASGTFVTVHDYVSALHPWLMGMKEDIRRSDVWDCGLTDMMVVSHRLNVLNMQEKPYWISHTSTIGIPYTGEQCKQMLLSIVGPQFGPQNKPDDGGVVQNAQEGN